MKLPDQSLTARGGMSMSPSARPDISRFIGEHNCKGAKPFRNTPLLLRTLSHIGFKPFGCFFPMFRFDVCSDHTQRGCEHCKIVNVTTRKEIRYSIYWTYEVGLRSDNRSFCPSRGIVIK